MAQLRRQLSLYLPPQDAKDIEAVRARVDPAQHGLIPAHVTLCRDEEVDVPGLHTRLQRMPFAPLRLVFGKPAPFSTHGLLLHCLEGAEAFRALREFLLDSTAIRDQQPHVTLAHPRNPKAEGNDLRHALALPGRIPATFPAVHLIEQAGLAPWRVLETYALGG